MEQGASSVILKLLFFCVSTTQYKMYPYHLVLQILMPTLKILVFWDVLVVGGFEAFNPTNCRNNNTV
jgi:hypothetical protein